MYESLTTGHDSKLPTGRNCSMSINVVLSSVRHLYGRTFIAIVALLLFSSAQYVSGQEPRHRPKPSEVEEMEKYDMPPAGFWGTGTSPAMESVYGAFTSHQVNVNASGMNVVGDAANEPSICVDPTNHNRMAIGWRQFNSVTSNFRQSGY